VTYGDFNFKRDARIVDLINPSNYVVHSRLNPACTTPKVVVQNVGSEEINMLDFYYNINDKEGSFTTWMDRTIPPMGFDTLELYLNPYTFWKNLTQGANTNKLKLTITRVNGFEDGDENPHNNEKITIFNLPEIAPSVFTLEFRTNNNPAENNYKIYDIGGNLIDQQTFTQANFTFSKAYNLGGCFKLVVEDKGQDGVQWWANSAQGTGFIRLKRANGQIFKTFQPDFGGGFEYSFTTNWALSNEDKSLNNEVLVYPNPAKEKLFITGNNLEHARITLINILGQTETIETMENSQGFELKTIGLKAGVYIVKISRGEESITRKIIIE
jgi:hypothetical protein